MKAAARTLIGIIVLTLLSSCGAITTQEHQIQFTGNIYQNYDEVMCRYYQASTNKVDVVLFLFDNGNPSLEYNDAVMRLDESQILSYVTPLKNLTPNSPQTAIGKSLDSIKGSLTLLSLGLLMNNFGTIGTAEGEYRIAKAAMETACKPYATSDKEYTVASLIADGPKIVTDSGVVTDDNWGPIPGFRIFENSNNFLISDGTTTTAANALDCKKENCAVAAFISKLPCTQVTITAQETDSNSQTPIETQTATVKNVKAGLTFPADFYFKKKIANWLVSQIDCANNVSGGGTSTSQPSTPKPASSVHTASTGKPVPAVDKTQKPKIVPTDTIPSADSYLNAFMNSGIDCGILWTDSTHDYGGIPKAKGADTYASCYSSDIWVNGHGHEVFIVSTMSKKQMQDLRRGNSSCGRFPTRLLYSDNASFTISTQDGSTNYLDRATQFIESNFGAQLC